MKKSEKKMTKRILGTYNQCMNALNHYMNPEMLVDSKGVIRKVNFPSDSYMPILKSKINSIKAGLK